MDRPSSSKKSKLDISNNVRQCEGLLIPKPSGPLPPVEERFEIYMIDAEPLLEYSSDGFRLFVSRFTDQILINYISMSEFDVPYKCLANKYRWLYVIRQVWLKLPANEKNLWEKIAKSKKLKIDDHMFDLKLHQAIQRNIYEQSGVFREKVQRETAFKAFIEANTDELFVIPSQLTFLVDYSVGTISPHTISFFKVSIHLDYFLDSLFEIDAERTSELIKYAIFYSDEKDDSQLSLSLIKLMPGLKANDQHMWIIRKLREYKKHFDVRELSLFPLQALERFFLSFNSVDYNERRARHIRQQAIDLGIVDIVLDCLSFFAHQRARCKNLRPSHMDMAHFQIDYMTERVQKDTSKQSAQKTLVSNYAPQFQHIYDFNNMPIDVLGINNDGIDFEYHSTNDSMTQPPMTFAKKKGRAKNKKDFELKPPTFFPKPFPQQPPLPSPSIVESIDSTFYNSYAEMNIFSDSGVCALQTTNSAAINRRQKKPAITPYAANVTPSVVKALKVASNYRTLSKFAKGTGYSTGTSLSVWNVSEHMAKKKYEMEHVSALLKILQAFIKPKSILLDEILRNACANNLETSKTAFLDIALSLKGDECAMIDEKLLQLLNRSCLRKTLIAYLVNDSLLDITKNLDIYETVFMLLAVIAQTGHVEAYSSLFVIERDDQESDADDSDEDPDEDVASSSASSLPCSSTLEASTSSGVFNTPNARRSKRRGSNEAIKKIANFSHDSSKKQPTQPKSSNASQKHKENSEEEVEHTNREHIDIFHFLFLDNWFASEEQRQEDCTKPLLLNKLTALSQQIDCYLSRIGRRGDTSRLEYQQNLSAEDLEMVSGDEERLRNLSFLSKLICAVIEKKIALADSLVESKKKHDKIDEPSEPSSSSRKSVSAKDEAKDKERKEREDYYCNQIRPLQFDTIPFYVPGSDRLALSYFYQRDIAEGNASTFGKNIRRITQEIISLSTSLPLSYSSSVFIRSSEERIHAAKMLVTGPAGTPYANGCFEFDIHFSDNYPNEPMRVNLQTTGNGSVRFNPNLYNCGKVCLSILNTWAGRPEERWNAETSSLLQVIVSLQSLVLVPEPYFNEPGFQTSIGTPAGKKCSSSYNSTIRVATVRWAMLEMLKHPPTAFIKVIHRHFYLKRDEICRQIEEWIADERLLNPVNCGKIEGDFEKLKHEFDKLMKRDDIIDKTL